MYFDHWLKSYRALNQPYSFYFEKCRNNLGTKGLCLHFFFGAVKMDNQCYFPTKLIFAVLEQIAEISNNSTCKKFYMIFITHIFYNYNYYSMLLPKLALFRLCFL